jgi:hypothetical protein
MLPNEAGRLHHADRQMVPDCIALINRIDDPASVRGIQLPLSKGQRTLTELGRLRAAKRLSH